MLIVSSTARNRLAFPSSNRQSFVVNVKAAKALGREIPGILLTIADEVIDEAPRVHHAARRRGGGVAARGARTAATSHDAGDWLFVRGLA
jgi:hypothetical protein